MSPLHVFLNYPGRHHVVPCVCFLVFFEMAEIHTVVYLPPYLSVS
jgi:hypothetical protein